eukprot:TRINITY_DN14695_c0_g1_i1.p1 TRINITY_DN14695_c0_g1~~TRINITY_DN14695_c0_g1_i1.p1  ORF type:complete len:1304 (-),score=176.05 TRINITY_DN14695_c0_g1_i1:44-3955(-)
MPVQLLSLWCQRTKRLKICRHHRAGCSDQPPDYRRRLFLDWNMERAAKRQRCSQDALPIDPIPVSQPQESQIVFRVTQPLSQRPGAPLAEVLKSLEAIAQKEREKRRERNTPLASNLKHWLKPDGLVRLQRIIESAPEQTIPKTNVSQQLKQLQSLRQQNPYTPVPPAPLRLQLKLPHVTAEQQPKRAIPTSTSTSNLTAPSMPRLTLKLTACPVPQPKKAYFNLKQISEPNTAGASGLADSSNNKPKPTETHDETPWIDLWANFERYRVAALERTATAMTLLLTGRLRTSGSPVFRRVILQNSWAHTPAQQHDLVHVLHPVWSPPDGVSTVEYCVLRDPSPDGGPRTPLLVVCPDTVVKTTTVSNATFCLRRAWLEHRLRPSFGSAFVMVRGNILHNVFQTALRSRQWDTQSLTQFLAKYIRESGEELFACRQTEQSAMEALSKSIPNIQQWLTTFCASVNAGTLGSRGGAVVAPGTSAMTCKISNLVDIEETVSPISHGLAGAIDATVMGTFFAGPQPMNPEDSVIPIELKTGYCRDHGGNTSHRGQLVLYTSLLSLRYNSPPNRGLLVYLPQPSSPDKAADPAITCSVGSPLEMAHAVQLRNTLAVHISKGKAPPMLRSWRACRNCSQLDNCLLWHKAQEGGTAESSGLGDEWQRLTGHLNPEYLKYLSHWDSAITLEAEADTKVRQDVPLGEREIAGRAISFLHMLEETNECLAFQRDHNRRLLSAQAPEVGTLVSLGLHGVDGLQFHSRLVHGTVVEVISQTTNPLTIRISVQRRPNLAHLLLPPAVQFWWFVDIVADSAGTAAIPRMRHHVFQLGWEASCRRKLQLVVDLAVPRFDSLQGPRSGDIVSEFVAWHLSTQAHPRPIACSPDLSNENSQAKRLVFLDQLNSDQRTVLRTVLRARDYTCVLGMPGTGKTTTVAMLVAVLAHLGKNVLVTAHTHSAVDSILLKCHQLGVPFIRLGGVEKVHPTLRPYVLSSGMQLTELEKLFLTTRVIATTAMSIHASVLSRKEFDVCVLDEASQMLQPVALGPLFLARAFVLVGDHHQLPPLVRSRAAQAAGMGESLFKRLCTAHPAAVVKLSLQYRMNAAIMGVANHLTYGGQLKAGDPAVAMATLTLPGWEQFREETACPWLLAALDPSRSVVFLNTDANDALPCASGNNLSNGVEAEIIGKIVESMVNCGLPSAGITVISPFHAQLQLLSRRLSAFPDTQTLTIDKSQGRDADCVLLSLVHKNQTQQINEILQDATRVNVAVTRARVKLIIIGSWSTFMPNPPWTQLCEYITLRGWAIPVTAVSPYVP